MLREGSESQGELSRCSSKIFVEGSQEEKLGKTGDLISISEGGLNEGRWTDKEHRLFISEILRIGIKNWKQVKIKFY